MLIDSHHHFWNPARGDYGWMPPDDPVLARPYAPADLAPALAAAGVEKTVLVQAAPSVEETEYMLGLADATPSVAAVVGWVDFERPEAIETLRRLARHPKFVGVRPMIQDIADDDWMLRDDVQWAYRALIDLDLTFDCLGFPRHLANFHKLLTRYPELRAVIDHCMKPQLRAHSETSFQFWADGLSRLADDTGAYCKLSGLATEADEDWSAPALQPYAAHVLSAFSGGRVMWGSDWPVCRLRAEYGVWFETAQTLVEGATEAERADLFGGAARRFYRIA